MARNKGIPRVQNPPAGDGHHVPDARWAPPKTPIKGGGGLRPRWKDKEGIIFEWDFRHGAVEKYTKRDRHLGEYNHETGEQTKPADPTRRIEP
ncbi:colicin E3/pyocin S6 family cytotoxin [Pseudomonas fluorescens]|uniref:colicin E3/pyocin S6 family cytotoxin n=1 Tax=Pseudomonas fluorescens TaxID=294 RepID=UPI0037483A1E